MIEHIRPKQSLWGAQASGHFLPHLEGLQIGIGAHCQLQVIHRDGAVLVIVEAVKGELKAPVIEGAPVHACRDEIVEGDVAAVVHIDSAEYVLQERKIRSGQSGGQASSV